MKIRKRYDQNEQLNFRTAADFHTECFELTKKGIEFDSSYDSLTITITSSFKRCPSCETFKKLEDEYYIGKSGKKINKPSAYCKKCTNYKTRHYELDLPYEELIAPVKHILEYANPRY